jgi:actin-like ATPase involved in cell morphogenesis
MAAAIGGGGPVSKSEAVTVVDIGASRIQAAVISLAGIVAWREAVCADEVSPERVGDLVRSVISECIAKGRCNLADDIVRQGVLLTGGGALTPGLADSMQSALNLPVRVADDPQLAVILGAGVVLGELDALARPKAKAPIPWTGLLIFAIVMLSLCKKHGLINRVIDLFVR